MSAIALSMSNSYLPSIMAALAPLLDELFRYLANSCMWMVIGASIMHLWYKLGFVYFTAFASTSQAWFQAWNQPGLSWAHRCHWFLMRLRTPQGVTSSRSAAVCKLESGSRCADS